MPNLGDFLQNARQLDGLKKRRGKPAGKPTSKNSKTSSGNSTVWIYFASESGTAKGFAYELAVDVINHGYQANVVDLQSFDPAMFRKHRCVILVVSTYGNGEAPSTCKKFESFLDDTCMPRNFLAQTHFAVFGLGSREYVDFNAFGRHCDAALAFFGAKRTFERGEGDDAADIARDFYAWKGNGLWQALESVLGTQKQGNVKVSLKHHVKSTSAESDLAAFTKWFVSAGSAEVVEVRELRQQPDTQVGETTKHIELSVDGSELRWHTAGTLEILPRNKVDDVDWFAARLSATESGDLKGFCSHARGPCRECGEHSILRDALALQCDISGRIQRQTVQDLFAMVVDPVESQILQTLIKDTQAFHWLTSVAQLTLREFIEIFLPSTTIDISTFLTICPRNRPRPYTIAASRLEDPNRVAICVRMLQRDLPSLPDIIDKLRCALGAPSLGSLLDTNALSERRCFRGMSSSYLCTGINAGDQLYVAARLSTFILPSLQSTPIVMVCAGAGVAPFRAFLHEFAAEGRKRADTSLFAGYKRENFDFLYDTELKAAISNSSSKSDSKRPPALGALSVAFSRDTSKAQYVQSQLQEKAVKVKSMFLDGAIIFVCGGSKMGQAVRETISKVLDVDDIKLLQQDGRYVEELW